MSPIAFLLVGPVAGCASLLAGGGLVTRLVSGVIGAFVGAFTRGLTGPDLKIISPLVTKNLTDAIGAAIVILLARIVA